jgi:hypothetical protein
MTSPGTFRPAVRPAPVRHGGRRLGGAVPAPPAPGRHRTLGTARVGARRLPPPQRCHPTARVDRTPYCRALARLSVAGDELASRALLQLLVPALLGLPARWRTLGSLADPDGEVIRRAPVYLSRLNEADIACNPAGWLLWSVLRGRGGDRARRRPSQLNQPTEADVVVVVTPPGDSARSRRHTKDGETRRRRPPQ